MNGNLGYSVIPSVRFEVSFRAILLCLILNQEVVAH